MQTIESTEAKTEREDKSPNQYLVKTTLNQTITNNFEQVYGCQAIMCNTNQAEPFIRRAALKLGWQEVGTAQSNKFQFHIRFSISDIEQ